MGGLGYSHKRRFCEYVNGRSLASTDREVVMEAFRISELICELTSSDPYAREAALEELGGTVSAMFGNLGSRIVGFIEYMRAATEDSR